MGLHRGQGWYSRRIVLMSGVAALVLGAAGCGGDGTAAPPPPAAPAAAPSPAPSASPAPAASPAAPAAAPATAQASSAVPVPGSSAPSTPARCTSAGLRVTLGGPEGAAGSVYRPLVFTNTGGTACELRGFPGVSYVTGDGGQQVGEAAQEVGPRGGQVRIAPGGSASAPVRLVQVGVFDAAACRPTPVRGLRVYPPGDTASLFVPAEGTGCAGTTPEPQLTVGTVAAG